MKPKKEWRAPPGDLSLEDTAVHLWRVNLARPEETVAALHLFLAPDEQERAARFHFQRHRDRYIVGRGALRDLIGQYLDRPPASIQFRYSDHGKPQLAAVMDAPDFRFNVTHAKTLALIAFTWGREIGVDVEFVRRLDDALAIAERHFSPREFAQFRRLPPQQRVEAFFNCWTRKEAFIKAIGEGLSHPLDTFDVSFAPGETAVLRQVDGSPAKAARWRLESLTPAPGYIAALLVKGHNWRLHRFTYDVSD
jgi:4'-phosphopantetheinyl transferase